MNTYTDTNSDNIHTGSIHKFLQNNSSQIEGDSKYAIKIVCK